MSAGPLKILLAFVSVGLLLDSDAELRAEEPCHTVYQRVEYSDPTQTPQARIKDRERQLRRLVLSSDHSDPEKIRTETEAMLREAQDALQARGFETKILPYPPANLLPYPVLHIVRAPEEAADKTARNIRKVTRYTDDQVNVIFDPVSLVADDIAGSWNFSQRLMRVDIGSLLETRKLPSTLIHERLHFEKAVAIAEGRSGALKPFYGYLESNYSLSGKSSYAKHGHLSVDEVKAWRLTLRAEEESIFSLIHDGIKKHDGIIKMRMPQLLAEYKHYVDLIDDTIINLDAVDAYISAPKLPRGVSLEERPWFGDKKSFTAVVRTSVGTGAEFAYVVPLVDLKVGAPREAAQVALKTQVKESLAAAHNHRRLAQSRFESIQKISEMDDLSARNEFERLLRPSN